ncbi:DMT family transporter [Yinghuangia seranimata]|uniref:DMT family transporter n=1 Tax=Yinghuangia seranimata TaxID=408067 RepID=UPI00248D2C72|nr:DMT family transporter [Yinghuangia seranimata]MDI2124855.1 DMT family transporter [Yinghuangia seranimata]
MTRKAWLLFASMSIVWGVSYLFIKIAVDEMSAPVVVVSRTAIAAIVLVPLALRRRAFDALRGRFKIVALLAMTHVTGPFLLITYGEVHISSSLTALLIASQPIMIALIALKIDASERVTGPRAVGLAVGLGGVATLVGFDLTGDRLGLLGAGMVLLASLGYACSTLIVKRKLSDVPPLGIVASTMSITTVVLLPLAIATAPTSMPSGKALGSLAALGLVCTALAFLAFYQLIAEAGAGRAALITYINPVVAVLLGVLVLDEKLTWSIVAGTALILAGSWFATRPTAPAPQAPATASPVEGELTPTR